MLVVSSRRVAEDFDKGHKDVLEKIRGLVAENSAVKSIMIESSYENRGKQYPEYLLTRDGFSLLVMGFTGSKALEWKLKYIEAFNKMEKAIKSPYQGLSKELQAIILHDKKIQAVEARVEKLENTMTIDYSQQEELREIANKVVINALGGKSSAAYKIVGSRAFAELWRHVKQTMSVNSYRNIAAKDFGRAKEVITLWKPDTELSLMIIGANTGVKGGVNIEKA